jgi:hypothetical protein
MARRQANSIEILMRRPIAPGGVNAAPFSFFNAVSPVPPVVVLGISHGDSAGDGNTGG